MITLHKSRLFGLLVLSMAMVTLSACDKMAESPTWVSDAKVEVHDDVFQDTFKTSDLNKNMLRAIGDRYYRYGNGPMNIVVAYDPSSKTANATAAESEKMRITRELRTFGVRDPNVSVASQQGIGNQLTATFTFPALVAQAPESCGQNMMPGFDKSIDLPNDATNPLGYGFGCSVEAMMAQQVARPGDLLGRPGFETYADGRRQENVIERRGYYGGESYDLLEGETAVDD